MRRLLQENGTTTNAKITETLLVGGIWITLEKEKGGRDGGCCFSSPAERGAESHEAERSGLVPQRARWSNQVENVRGQRVQHDELVRVHSIFEEAASRVHPPRVFCQRDGLMNERVNID